MTIAKTDIEDKVIKLIAEKLAKSIDEISLDSKFIDDLGADSLDQVELMMAFEEKFGCEIPDEEAVKLQTVQQAINYITTHKKS
jgi:acyl carrier protein